MRPPFDGPSHIEYALAILRRGGRSLCRGRGLDPIHIAVETHPSAESPPYMAKGNPAELVRSQRQVLELFHETECIREDPRLRYSSVVDPVVTELWNRKDPSDRYTLKIFDPHRADIPPAGSNVRGKSVVGCHCSFDPCRYRYTCPR